MKRPWWMAALCLAAGCGGGDKPRLNGAGSTFIFPMMSKWAAEYDKAKNVEVNYQSIGSGGGIQQMTAKTADFGCTDGPMNDEQLGQASQSGGEVVHIPLVLGAIVPVYNLPDLKQPLCFSGPVLADVFLGKIRRWDDAALRDLNPGVPLPDREITVVHRSDGSGTTYVWVDYLTKVSPEWKRYVGVGTRVDWPVGESVKGCEGVAGRLKESPGAIGYIEMLYALQNNIPFGLVRNREGAFIAAGPQSVRAAAESGLAEASEDLRFSLTDSPGADSYPISGACWAVVFVNQPTDRGRPVFGFLSWCTHEGQAYADDLGYVALPPVLMDRLERQLGRISYSH